MGLGWLLIDDMPSLSAVEPPWATDAPDDLLQTVGRVLQPLVRALLLAGWRVVHLDITRPGTTRPTLRYDDFGLFEQPGTVLQPPPGPGSGVVLSVTDIAHDRAMEAVGAGAWLDPRGADPEFNPRKEFSHGLELPADAATNRPALLTGDLVQVVLWSAEDFATRAWFADLAGTGGTWATALTDAVADRAQAGDLTPRGHCGLLWLFNPLFWFAHDITFPGTEFDAALAGPPDVPLLWPEVTSPEAAGLDPTAMHLPDDQALAQMVFNAGLFALGLPSRADQDVPALAFDRAWLSEMRRRGRLGDLLHGIHAHGGRAMARQFVADVRTRGGGDDLALAVLRRPWLDAVLMLAESDLIAPAGYPHDTVEVRYSLNYEEFFGTDPVQAVYRPRTSSAFESVILTVAGLESVFILSTGFCEVPLLRAVAWDYLIKDADHQLTVVVVAGPGVLVNASGDRGDGWDLTIIRVWDYDTFPARGSRIQPEQFLSPFPVAWDPDDPALPVPEEGLPLYAMQVYPQPRGLVLEYPVPHTPDQTPSWRLTLTALDNDETARIAYDIVFGHAFPYDGHQPDEIDGPSNVGITIWVSPSVTVAYETLDGLPASAPGDRLQIWTIPDPMQIPIGNAVLPVENVGTPPRYGPPLGEPLPLPAGAVLVDLSQWDEVMEIAWTLMTVAVDIGLSQLPLAGDASDWVDVLFILAYGTDKWGRPLTFLDQMAYIGCALVPGVTTGMARLILPFVHEAADPSGYATELNRHAPPGELLLDFVSATRRLPTAVRELMEVVGSSRDFERFDMVRQARVLAAAAHLGQFARQCEVLGRGIGQTLSQLPKLQIVDLLTEYTHERRFWFPPLQRAFSNWCKRTGRVADDEAVLEWIIKTRGLPRAILQALLGNQTLDFIDDALVVARSPKISAWWPSMEAVALRASVRQARDYGDEAVGQVITSAKTLVTRYADEGRILGFATPDEVPRLAANVETLLNRVKNGPGMEALLGQKRAMEPEDMSEMLMRGMKILDRQLKAMSEASGVEMTLEKYLTIHGNESFFKDLLTQSGYEHGSLMETMVAAEEWIRLAKLGDVAPNELFYLQSAIGNTKGPDLVRVIDGKLQIVEAKSWAKIWFLLDAQDSAAEVQLWRYVDAMIANRLNLQLPGAPPMDPHPEIVFRIDPTAFINMSKRQQRPEVSLATIEERIDWVHRMVDERLKMSGLSVRFELGPLWDEVVP